MNPDREMRKALGPFHRAMKSMMRAQILTERRTRLARIKILKGMIKGIETALFKPDSKAAVLKLKAIRKQLIQDARDEATKLADRVKSSRRMLVNIGRGRWRS